MHVLEKSIRTYLSEQLQRVVNPVRSRVFFQILKHMHFESEEQRTVWVRDTYLIESTDRCYENDGIRVVEVGYPCMPLTTRSSDVEKMPGNTLAVEVNVKRVLRNTHGLDTGVENVI